MIFSLWNVVRKYLGWRNWAVFYYNSILENLFIVFYICLVKRTWSDHDLIETLWFILFSIFATSYGYLVNDFADRELDASHNKNNTFSDDSQIKSVLVVLGFFVLGWFFSVPFWSKFLFIPITVIWFLLATFYSLRPLRFKERRLTGLVIIILTQRVIPVLLVFSAFAYHEWLDILLITGLVFMRGAVSDIHHQLDDHINDVRTRTNTFAVTIGRDKMMHIFYSTLVTERIMMLIVLGLFLYRGFEYDFFGIPYLVLPTTFYLSLVIFPLLKKYTLEQNNPFSEMKNIFQVIHLVFPNLVLPVFFLIILIINNVNFILFIILYILIYRLYKLETLKNSFIGKLFSE